ncbi:MAG TPA: hypothetical protein PLQ50_01310 [Candidatus Woesebacteria bacterium]|nr:hypothetical protein [Candidatus Woesebacteria bacterium]
MFEILTNRYAHNPILVPDPNLLWEAQASFNPSVLAERDQYHFLYRSVSADMDYGGHKLNLSTIAYASSNDGIKLENKRQFITPTETFDKYGCEDPRLTLIDGEYFITYTAIGGWPPGPSDIKVALAISKDLKTIEEKHLVTPFNAKAMAFFPEKINGKYAALLTINTDLPPSKIAIAYFEKKSDIWSKEYWDKWLANLEDHLIFLPRLNSDHLEVGAVPFKTLDGWVLIYSHIQNYLKPSLRIFGVEAVLLDLENPEKIVGRTTKPIFIPERDYELRGMVNNVVFPTGAIVVNDELRIYYGAADKVGAFISLKLMSFLSLLKQSEYKEVLKLRKFSGNPILQPNEQEAWQAQAVFNAAAIRLEDKTYLLFRAMSHDNTSTIGCAISEDGYHFTQILHEPIYVPRMDFETKKRANGFSGCEDPRLTIFGDRIYMFYTAYDGVAPPRVALTSIFINDFISHRFVWDRPILISNPEIDDKNACLFPEKINGYFVICHRANGRDISLDYVSSLEDFKNGLQLEKEGIITARSGHWDGAKIGIAGPPIKTDKGWLLIYHGVSEFDRNYRLGYIILDLEDPFKVLYRSIYPILEPELEFEKIGVVDNVVFSCGATVVNKQLFVYYGAADKVMAVATLPLEQLLQVI